MKITKKKIAKKTKEKLIAKILHYYANIKVAVIKLKDSLKVGDEIRIVGGKTTDFQQKISSMEIDCKKIKIAKKGKSIGIKLNKKVREGYKVYKI